MEVEREEPLELWEVLELLEKRKGDKPQFDTTDQRKVYEYAKEAAKLEKKDALELLNILMKKFHLPKKIAIQMVDVLPLTAQEIEPFIVQLEEEMKLESKEEKDALMSEILSILREYADKAKSLAEAALEEVKEER